MKTAAFLLLLAIPPSSRILKQVLVGSLAQPAQTRELVQPLFFVLDRTHDRESARVLAELTWYRFGESDDEILRCLLINRAIADPTVTKELASPTNDCQAKFGEHSPACRSAAEHEEVLRELRREIATRKACELEY